MIIDASYIIDIDDTSKIISAAFSPDGEMVYLHTASYVLNLWSLTLSYWPEIGGAIIGVLTLLVSLYVLRVLANPESTKGWHCPKCKYQISSIDDALDESYVCPECGLVFSYIYTRLGRSALKRIALPSITLCVILLIYAYCHISGIGRIGRLSDLCTIPSRNAYLYAKTHNIKSMLLHECNAEIVQIIDVRSGEIERSNYYLGVSTGPALLSKDGTMSYRTRIETNQKGHRLLWLESLRHDSGKQTIIAKLPIDLVPNGGNRSVICFHNNGSKVLIAGRKGNENLILAVDLESGDVEVVATQPEFGAGGSWTAVVDDIYTPTVMVTMSGSLASGTVFLRRFTLIDQINQTTERWYPTRGVYGSVSVASGGVPSVFPDGNRIAIASGSNRYMLNILNLTTNDIQMWSSIDHETQRPIFVGDQVALSPTGNHVVIVEQRSGGNLLIYNSDTTEKVLELSMDPLLVEPKVVYSTDGRHILAYGVSSKGIDVNSWKYGDKLIVYDISSSIINNE